MPRTCGSSAHRMAHAVERHAVGEVDERLAQLLERAVVVEVLAVDVRDHRHRRARAAGRSRRSRPPRPPGTAPVPSRAFEPMDCSRPPTTMVGSSPPRASTAATSEVVVVLPCEPATATPYFMRISSASMSARGITGMPCARAADDLRVVRRGPRSRRPPPAAPSTLAASCPCRMRPPRAGQPLGGLAGRAGRCPTPGSRG